MNALMALAIVATAAFLLQEFVDATLALLLIGASPLTMFG